MAYQFEVMVGGAVIDSVAERAADAVLRSARPARPATVVIVLQETARALETAAVWECFGSPRGPRRDLPEFAVEFAAASPDSRVDLFGAGSITADQGLDRVPDADLVFLAPPIHVPLHCDPHLGRALQVAAAQGTRIMATDTSVFTLAHAGLLDGRSATTHWSLADAFVQRFPSVDLRAEALYIEDGPVLTAAGAMATLDLCLHVIATTAGTADVAELEQHLLTGAHRSGRFGQRLDQPSLRGRRSDHGISDLLEWIERHLHEDLSLDLLSRQMFMSRRSLTRRFRAATGTTPYAWILDQRLRLARELLAGNADMTVERVAVRAGFGTAGVLRRHFQLAVGCTPSEYRALTQTPTLRAAGP